MNFKKRTQYPAIIFTLLLSLFACEKDDDVTILNELSPNGYKKNLSSGSHAPEGYNIVDIIDFHRVNGKPSMQSAAFNLTNTSDSIILRIENGPENSFKTSSAILQLNGFVFLRENDLNQNIDYLEYCLKGESSNQIEALLRGKPGSSLRVYVFKKKLELDLLAFYPFNGNSNDESGNGYDGSNTNVELVEDRFGSSSSAYRFNGNSSIKIGDLDLNDPFSISIWLNAEDTEGKRWIINKSGSNNTDNYGAILDNNQIKFVIKSNVLIAPKQYEYAEVSAPIPENQWLHLVFVWDGHYLTLYLNGSIMDQETAEFEGLITNNSMNTTLGNRELGICCGQHPYLGILDEVIFINEPINEDEVMELYLEGYSL